MINKVTPFVAENGKVSNQDSIDTVNRLQNFGYQCILGSTIPSLPDVTTSFLMFICTYCCATYSHNCSCLN